MQPASPAGARHSAWASTTWATSATGTRCRPAPTASAWTAASSSTRRSTSDARHTMSAFGPALRFVLSLLAAALCAPLFAQVPGKAYAQELVDRTVARHPGLLAVTLHATPSGGGEPVMIASTIGRIGHPAGGRRVDVALPLLDTTGIVVGTLGLS